MRGRVLVRLHTAWIRRALTKAQLPASCVLSEGVRARHDCFYMCSNKECQKIYWQVSPSHHVSQISCCSPVVLLFYSIPCVMLQGQLSSQLYNDLQGNQYGNALENLASRVLKQPHQMQLA